MDEPAASDPLLSAEDGKINPSDFGVKICPEKCETNREVSANETDAKDGADDRLEFRSKESIVLCIKILLARVVASCVL